MKTYGGKKVLDIQYLYNFSLW